MRPWIVAHRFGFCLLVGVLGTLAGLGLQGQSAPPLLPSLPIQHVTPDSLADPTPATLRQRREHLAKLGVDRWHHDGQRGQGIKVAILDSGFRGYRSFLGKGLPENVKVHSFRKDGDLEARDSQHGILCAEVVHALAPAAQIVLANWEPDSPESFLQAVRWAKGEGARIMTCSVIMPNWSDGEGGGQIHAALSRLLGSGEAAGDVLCFASAGNTAQRHWSGTLHPDVNGFHQWKLNSGLNALRPFGPERISVQLYGPARGSCELQVLEEGTGTLVGKAPLHADPKIGWGQATVRFNPAPNKDYWVRLRCPERSRLASDSDKFHVVALGGALQCCTAGGSIPFPADGARVIAVGAVDGDAHRMPYSSCGPNSLKPKPDLMATVPFPCFCRERPFAGTSAAAPQAAALAALLLGKNPLWTPQQVQATMQKAALDLCTPGHDCETGYGLIRLPGE